MSRKGLVLSTAVATIVAATGIAIPVIYHHQSLPLAQGPQVTDKSDGYTRYAVTLNLGAPQAAAPSATQPTSTTGGKSLDTALLKDAQARLGTGGTLTVAADGTVNYTTSLGSERVGGFSVVGGQPAANVTLPAAQSTTAEQAIKTLVAQPGVKSAQIIDGNTALIATDFLTSTEVAALPGVASISPTQTGTVDSGTFPSPKDPYYTAYGWDLNNTGSNAMQLQAKKGADVKALEGWNASLGDNIVVAVIDTGFESTHPDIKNALWTNPRETCGSTVDNDGNGKIGDCHGWNFYANSADVDNTANGADNSHGVAVSGLIAGAMDGTGMVGIAPNVRIMPLAIGSGGKIDAYLGAAAIRYAVDNGANIINTSWGGPFTGDALKQIQDAVQYAQDHNVIIVTSAANDGLDRDTNLNYPASLPNPNLVVVGSTNALDEPSTFSAHGAKNVDLYAPGENLITPWPGNTYRAFTGTSGSSPLVAGALALYESAFPGISPTDAVSRLLSDVQPLTSLKGLCVTGGRLSLHNLGASIANVTYNFSQMNAEPDKIAPVVKVSADTGQAAYKIRLGFFMNVKGEAWAVSQVPVTLMGQTVTTNDQGQADFFLGNLDQFGAMSLSPKIDLGEGQYALTAQLYGNDAPLTPVFAAPLNVATASTSTPAPSSSTPAPTSNPGSGTNPTTDPSNPGSGTNPTTDPSNPGSGTNPTSNPSTPTSNPTQSTNPSNPGSGTNPTTNPSTPTSNPTQSTNPSNPGSGTNPTTNPSTPTSNPTSAPSTEPTTKPSNPTVTPVVVDPVPTTNPSTPTNPSNGGTNPPKTTYPADDTFQITSVSPSVVTVDGGQSVQITGNNLNSKLEVRVGGTRSGQVISATTNSLIFLAPPAAAGTYSVTVYSATASTVLDKALTYVAKSSSTSPTTQPTSSPTTQPGTSPKPTSGSTPAPSATPSPTPTKSTTTQPGTSPSTQTPAPGTGGVKTMTGPRNVRLVYNENTAKIYSSVFTQTCSTTCTGKQV